MTAVSKLFYILPECAYAVELLPSKKPNSFTVHTFRQINGAFMDDNEFIAENVDKLIRKFDPETYQLILPDFLFTNTIIDIAETNEDAVIKHLKQNVLPDLGLNTQDHYLETFILTQHQKKSKVQLSALEKSVLTPLLEPASEQNIHFESVIPLSWSVKSAISLEPSLSTIQMGEKLYVAQHYIGVDQAIVFDISETKNIIETVKTLKGAEPNIQTMYLLTNSLVENELKEHLSGTLPLQQLANQVEAHDEMPAHVRYIVETAARTLSIADYPVPRFIPDQSAKGATSKALPIATLSESDQPASSADDTTTPTADVDPSDDGADEKEDMKADSPIPSPTMPPTSKGAKAKAVKAEPKEETPKATVAIEDITPVEDTDTADSLAKPAASVAAAATALGSAASLASAATSVVPAASVSATSALMTSSQPTPPSVSSDSKPAAAVVDITEKVLKTPESAPSTESADAKTEPKDIDTDEKDAATTDKPKSISLSDSDEKSTTSADNSDEKDIADTKVAAEENALSVDKPSEDVPTSGVKIEPTSAVVAAPVTAAATTSSGSDSDKSETTEDGAPSVSPDSTSTISSTVAAPAAVVSSTAKETMSDTSAAASTASSTSGEVKPMRPVLKKKNDAGSLLKVVFATVAALVVTVAIGVGIGFGLLKMNQKKPVTQQPVASPKATVAPTPSETTTTTATGSGTTTSATGSAALAKAKIKILVVNATKIAGKAGKTKSTLTTAGYKLVDTGNAKGEYSTAGTYILVSKTAPVGLNTDLAKELKVTSGDAADQLAAEDPKGEYDAVIVLNE